MVGRRLVYGAGAVQLLEVAEELAGPGYGGFAAMGGRAKYLEGFGDMSQSGPLSKCGRVDIGALIMKETLDDARHILRLPPQSLTEANGGACRFFE